MCVCMYVVLLQTIGTKSILYVRCDEKEREEEGERADRPRSVREVRPFDSRYKHREISIISRVTPAMIHTANARARLTAATCILAA